MLLKHSYSSDCWQLSGLLPVGGGQKSTEQSPASTLVTILIVFIWLYSVLFVAIPSMSWRDVSGANLLFLKVFKFVGLLTNFLTFLLFIITNRIHIKIYGIALKVARLDFLGLIPPNFEH